MISAVDLFWYAFYLGMAWYLVATLKVVIRLFLLKLKHGSEIQICYFPIMGMRRYFKRDFVKHGDSLYSWK